MMPMPIIGLCARSFDPLGAVILRNIAAPRRPEVSRRVTRTATLDGGCSIFDGGYTAVDATVRLSVHAPSIETAAAIQRLCRLYARLLLALPEGCYEVAPESATIENNNLAITLLVTGEL